MTKKPTNYMPGSKESLILQTLPPEVDAHFLQNNPVYKQAIKANERYNVIMKQKKIIDELDKTGIPDLSLIFSDELLEVIPGLLESLFKSLVKSTKNVMKIPKEKLSFEKFFLFGNKDDDGFWYLWSLVNQYAGFNNSKEIRKIIQDFQPKVAAFTNENIYDKKKHEILGYLLENTLLTDDQKIILKRCLKNGIDVGIELEESKTNRLKEIRTEIGILTKKFGNNVLDAQKDMQFHFRDKSKIEEMPEDILDLANKLAIKHSLEGYLFLCNDANLIMTYCKNSKVNKDVNNRKNSIASFGENDNRGICLQVLNIRQEMAQILGYENYSDLVLRDYMSGSAEKVKEVLSEIHKYSKIKGKKEEKELFDYFGVDKIETWDIPYHSRIYNEKKYDYDQKKLRRFFEIDMAIEGLVNIAKQMYEVDLKEIEGNKYAEGVKYYEVHRNGLFLGYYILDLLARNEKKSGAWNNILRNRQFYNGKKQYPIMINVASLGRGKKGEILIGMNGVKTLFHEFGHAIHSLLGESEHQQLAGTQRLERDFSELPSTLMENYASEPSILKGFAKDYKTGEVIGDEMISLFEKSKNAFSGMNDTSSIMISFLDLLLYSEEVPKTIEELDKKVYDIFEKYSLSGQSETSSKYYCSFSHIFEGGYASVFYSYLWARIIDSQVFSEFKEKGVFDKNTTEKYIDTILSKGSKRPAMDMLKDFTGKEIDIKPYLKNKGYIK